MPLKHCKAICTHAALKSLPMGSLQFLEPKLSYEQVLQVQFNQIARKSTKVSFWVLVASSPAEGKQKVQIGAQDKGAF